MSVEIQEAFLLNVSSKPFLKGLKMAARQIEQIRRSSRKPKTPRDMSKFTPTPEQIAAECKLIQATWTWAERRRRSTKTKGSERGITVARINEDAMGEVA